ncbi:uncharacterized protein N7469_003991 [Penicillium citrinum]|uniref:Integral membrane protein n=2 Tax=Penicillium TaxID=5073 RepID=A0A9W9P688_PENCI|nr:uncharacterized protein N7469_003991 [Penicillium citrinum]KAJ5234823.1 hypothetical protein N7469_003991 [Penicillium citrinum]KAJ5590443.1 hypothetical protein N7450_004415 [Penicillium hetheringtonii]
MGKAGRIACIFTPYILTIASLICIIIVGLGCTKASDSNLSDLYFVRIDLQNISSNGTKTVSEIKDFLNEHDIKTVTADEVSDVLKTLQDDSSLADFYSIGLWGYCEGSINDNGDYKTTKCSKPKTEFYFDPLSVWGLSDNDQIKNELPDDYNKIMKIYKAVSKWMFIAYLISFILGIVELIVGLFAICSRWGSCVTTLVAVTFFIFIAASSITATVLFSVVDGTAGNLLKAYGIEIDMGKNMLAATWLAVAFALIGAIFWTFSVCCCSGRSPYGHKDRRTRGITAEKAPYTYEPIGATGAQPYGSHHTSYPAPAAHGGEYPMTNTHQQHSAYEPFRHV